MAPYGRHAQRRRNFALLSRYALSARDTGRRTDAVGPYELICREADTVSPGCEELLFLPYLTAERTPHPDPYARRALIGLTVRHTKAHMARAVLEGVSFGLCDSLKLSRRWVSQLGRCA